MNSITSKSGELASIADRTSELTPYRSTAEEITSTDLALPRLYVAQSNTKAVQDGLVAAGSLFVASDPSDPDLVVVHKPGSEGVVVYPLGIQKKWTGKDENEDFRVWEFHDPNVPESDDIKLAYVYALLVPVFDVELPASLMLKSTATQTAKKMNLAIKRAEPQPPWSVAFTLSTEPQSNALGRWHKPVARSVQAKSEHVQAAQRLAVMMGLAVESGSVEHADGDEEVPF